MTGGKRPPHAAGRTQAVDRACLLSCVVRLHRAALHQYIKDMSILKKRFRKGETMARFLGSLREGDVRSIPLDKFNIGSLRTVAGKLNMKAGYTRYSVNDDSKVTNSIRVICSPKD